VIAYLLNRVAANLGYEQKRRLAADTLRGTMDAAEYKHTVLGGVTRCNSILAVLRRRLYR
jgi:hypothetical protein